VSETGRTGKNEGEVALCTRFAGLWGLTVVTGEGKRRGRIKESLSEIGDDSMGLLNQGKKKFFRGKGD